MPMAPPRACATCGQVGCAGHHTAAAWQTRTAPLRLRGRRLQRVNRAFLDAHPLCVHCAAQDRVTAATRRDHLVPLAEGGTDAPANLQALCDACHRLKTAAEARRGQWGG